MLDYTKHRVANSSAVVGSCFERVPLGGSVEDACESYGNRVAKAWL